MNQTRSSSLTLCFCAACGFERLGRGRHTARASCSVRERARPKRGRPVLRSIYRKMRAKRGMCNKQHGTGGSSSHVLCGCRRKMQIPSGHVCSLRGITRTGNNWRTQRSSQPGYVLCVLVLLSPLEMKCRGRLCNRCCAMSDETRKRLSSYYRKYGPWEAPGGTKVRN